MEKKEEINEIDLLILGKIMLKNKKISGNNHIMYFSGFNFSFYIAEKI